MSETSKSKIPEVTHKDLKKKSVYGEKPWKEDEKKSDNFYGEYYLIKNTENANSDFRIMTRKKITNTEKQAKAEIGKVLVRLNRNH